MTEPKRSDSQHADDARLDNALAEFTDRLLNASTLGSLPPIQAEPAEEDPDLRRLQSTILQLHAAIDRSLPDPAVQRRIQRHIKQEWDRYPPAQPSVLQRLRLGFHPTRRPALAFGLMCIVLALLAGLLTLLPENIAPPTGAAGQNGGDWVILALAGGIIALAALVYFLRRRS